jgi:hypothetical protein
MYKKKMRPMDYNTHLGPVLHQKILKIFYFIFLSHPNLTVTSIYIFLAWLCCSGDKRIQVRAVSDTCSVLNISSYG